MCHMKLKRENLEPHAGNASKKGRKGLCPRSRRRKKTQKEKENEIVRDKQLEKRSVL